MPEFLDKIASPTSSTVDPLISPVGKLSPLSQTLTEVQIQDYSAIIFAAKLFLLILTGVLLILIAFWFFFRRQQSKP